jgi:hypothetical protein
MTIGQAMRNIARKSRIVRTLRETLAWH